jgi:hypothetical protein
MAMLVNSLNRNEFQGASVHCERSAEKRRRPIQRHRTDCEARAGGIAARSRCSDSTSSDCMIDAGQLRGADQAAEPRQGLLHRAGRRVHRQCRLTSE